MRKSRGFQKLNSESKKQRQNPDDVIVVVYRHKSQPYNQPIDTDLIRRWMLPTAKKAWEIFLNELPASERGNFSISFDEEHLQAGGKR